MPKTKVTVEHSAQMVALREVGESIPSIVKKFPMYSRATIYRHCCKKVGQLSRVNKSTRNAGRPPKLSTRDKRKILRSIPQLRNLEGSFSSRRVATHAGITNVSNRTVRRCLNNAGYGFYQSRKKGLMNEKDREVRVKFCKKIKQLKCIDFWKKYISMYIDGVGFEFKTKPLDQAKAPMAREWRKKSEGLKITMKGKKEGSKNINFIVGISYRKGVVLCQQYEGAINGEKFTKIIKEAMPLAIQNSNAPQSKRILQDGCPRQNSKKALRAFDEIGLSVFKIPARSPDLNPIENFFHTIKKRLRLQAIEENIEAETIEEFARRTKALMLDCNADDIDKIVDSMGKRVDCILESGGYHSKY